MLRALPCVCLLILSLSISVAIGHEGEMKLVSDADLQKALAVVMASEECFELCPSGKRVIELTNGKLERLVPQLLFYSTQFEPGDPDARIKRFAAFHLLVNRLDIPVHTVMNALVPYLDSSDKVVRATVGELLISYENPSHNRPPDFSNFGGILESSFRQTGEPPTGLVRHMYEAHAPAALLSLIPSQPTENRDRDPKGELAMLLAEHTVSDVLWRFEHKFMDDAQARAAASEHLKLLAGSKRWWVRCYPAYMMKVHPVLRIEDIVQLLRKDTHKAVADVVQFAEMP